MNDKHQKNDELSDAAIKLALKDEFDGDAQDDGDTGTCEHSFSPEFEARMKIILSGEKQNHKTHKGRAFVRILKYAAVAVMILCTVFCAACAMIPSVRAQVWGIVTRYFDEYIELSYDKGTDVDSELERLIPSYVPAGYKLVHKIDSDFHIDRFYEDADGRYVSYSQSPLGGTTAVNNRGAVVSRITVNGLEGLRVSYPDSEDDRACEFIMWGDDRFEWSLLGYVGYDELMKMAQSLVSPDSKAGLAAEEAVLDPSVEPFPEFDVPEGFEVSIAERSTDRGRLSYDGGSERRAILDVAKTKNRTLTRPDDSYGAEVTEVKVKGFDGFMYYRECDYGGDAPNYETRLTWFDGTYLCEVEYSSPDDDDGAFAFKIAESLK